MVPVNTDSVSCSIKSDLEDIALKICNLPHLMRTADGVQNCRVCEGSLCEGRMCEGRVT